MVVRMIDGADPTDRERGQIHLGFRQLQSNPGSFAGGGNIDLPWFIRIHDQVLGFLTVRPRSVIRFERHVGKNDKMIVLLHYGFELNDLFQECDHGDTPNSTFTRATSSSFSSNEINETTP